MADGIKWPTPADVRKLQDETGVSVFEAVRDLEKRAMLDAANNAQSVEDFRVVIVAMLMRWR